MDEELDLLLEECYSLEESIFNKELTEDQNMVINELTKELEKVLINDKKGIYVKGNTITLKGTNLFNRFSSVRLSDVVEGIILRKYYNVKPKVHITVTYFKVGGKVTHDSYNKKKEKVTYSLGASYTYTTSIKIKVKAAKDFKVGRVIECMNNRDSSIAYEKLTEEIIFS